MLMLTLLLLQQQLLQHQQSSPARNGHHWPHQHHRLHQAHARGGLRYTYAWAPPVGGDGIAASSGDADQGSVEGGSGGLELTGLRPDAQPPRPAEPRRRICSTAAATLPSSVIRQRMT